MAARPIQPLVRCRSTHWGNLRKCSVFFTCQWPNVQGRTGRWPSKSPLDCGTVGLKCGMPIQLLLRQIAQISPILGQGIPIYCLADYVHYQWLNGGANMALSHQEVIQELRHEIHSPLAAIRNALYLAASRSTDP